MAAFPICLNLEGRLCVVVGDGAVGRRKARALQQAGARVRLIGPAANDPELPQVERVRRLYQSGDLAGACLAFAATDQRETNAAIAREARAAGIPVNVADDPSSGDFILPAVLRRGDLLVAVATGGRSPGLAAEVRDHLAATLGPEWEIVLEIAAALRQKKLTDSTGSEYNRAILRLLLEADLPALIAGRATPSIDRLLTTLGGEGCSLAKLGIRLPKGKT